MKKLFATLFCLVMTAAFMPTTTFAAEGTVIEISSESELREFAEAVNNGTDYSGKTIVLTKDITLNGQWTPIGNGTRGAAGPDDHYFTGTFDGQGYKISGLNVTFNKDNYGAGLFGAVKNATIQNVNIDGGSVRNDEDAAAGLVAIVLGDGTTNILNCTSSATVNGAAAAGIVSRVYGTTTATVNVKSCTNNGEININAGSADGKKAGGIACINNSVCAMNISGCTNSGRVSGGNDGVAGILGFGGSRAVIDDCKNTGVIGVGSPAPRYSGGIVGYATGKGSLVTGSVNEGEVSGNVCAGGIVGIISQSWSVKNSENRGAVKSADAAGGIVGNDGNGLIDNCKNSGTVYGENYAGGVVGEIGIAVVNNCAGGTASVQAGNAGYAGRIIGAAFSSPDMWTVLMIDDANGDSYEGIGTVGIVAPNTGWGKLVVAGGTLRGEPAANTTAVIAFGNDANWQGKTDVAGKSFARPGAQATDWTEQSGTIGGSYNIDLKPALVNGKEYDSVAAAEAAAVNGDLFVVLKAPGNDIQPAEGVVLLNGSGEQLTVNGGDIASGEQAVKHNLESVPAKAVTCTEVGNIAYWRCLDSGCNKYFKDADGTEEISFAATLTLPLGHQYKDGQCTICGEEDPDYVPEGGGEDKPAGEQAHEYKDGKCIICGAADPNYVPGSEGENNSAGEFSKKQTAPSTSDSSNMLVLLAIMMLAAGTAAGLKRKKAK